MHYFAYGSNMNLEHMRRLCGWHFNVVSVVALKDYEFGPDSRGYANIRPKKGGRVFGVLYELDQHCIDALDEFEGVPNVFQRIEVIVTALSGQEYTAFVYVESPELFGGSYIKTEYMRRVVMGAKQNNLPQEWVSFLEEYLSK